MQEEVEEIISSKEFRTQQYPRRIRHSGYRTTRRPRQASEPGTVKRTRSGVLSRSALGNEIAIRTDRGEYVGGDVVYGAVYLRIKEPKDECKCLKLIIRGSEICDFDYKYLDNKPQPDEEFLLKCSKRIGKKDILKQEDIIISYPHGFPEGHFKYPFMYKLPHNLQGSCSLEHMEGDKSHEGEVRYTVSAALEGEQAPKVSTLNLIQSTASDTSSQVLSQLAVEALACAAMSQLPSIPYLKVEQTIVVYHNLECKNPFMIKPDIRTKQRVVRGFFCISRGTVKMSAQLDRCAFDPNEKVKLRISIQNESSVDLTGFSVKLLRVIKLSGKDRNRSEKDATPTMLYNSIPDDPHIHEGCPKLSDREDIEEELDLGAFPDFISPSTSGNVVKCSYSLDVDFYFSWAPTVSISQPLLIRPKPNNEWKDWKPPTWVRECLEVTAMHQFTVPPELISSENFSGIPGFQPQL